MLVGRGPLEEPLRQRAAQRGWSERLKIVAVPSEQMPQMYNQMDCLALPSLTTPSWKEQFGRALTEAMACELPIVASDSGEIPNLLGDLGTICPEGNADALAAAIHKLYNEPRNSTCHGPSKAASG